MNRWRFDAEQERQSIKQTKVNFQPPRRDEWVVVLDNNGKDDAEVTVSLKAVPISK
jgi:hypothetical protein